MSDPSFSAAERMLDGSNDQRRQPLSVASVTIAYNAAHLLPRQIDALLQQSRPLQEIIIIDNASTDGTIAMFAERYPQVTLVTMPENLGAAGGWSAALALAALEKRHDWIWTLDNDSIPSHDALVALMTGYETLKTEHRDIGMIAPLAVDRNGSPYLPFFWQEGFVAPSLELLQQRVWFADQVIASGCMVSREMVEAIGLPRADFFMDVADIEYCLRARAHGYRIAVVNAARLVHEIGVTRQVRLPGYSVRWTEQAPFREYYISRNLAYLAWSLYPTRRTKKSILRYLLVHTAQVALFSSQKIACIRKIVQGFRDGLRASLGVRFRPS